MFREIEKNAKSVRVTIDQYNAEWDQLKKSMTTSVADVINEALKKQALEHQAEAQKAA